MATTYKILGQAQGSTAASQENINLYPDPNHEGYTATQDFSSPNPTTTAGATYSIWPFISGTQTSNVQQHWPLNSNSTHGGTQTSGRTGYVRFNNHNHSGNSTRVWQLDTTKTGTLVSGKTYTLNLWAHAHQDHGTDHHGQHALTELYYYDGSNWQPIIHNAQGETQSYLSNGTYSSYGQIQTNAAGATGSSVSNWNGDWRRWYKTFTAAGTAPFNMRVRLQSHGTDYWNRVYLDNVYLTEGAIPKALIPEKAPDGTSGNTLALHTTPFTTRSEGWASTAYQSPTIRKFTGEWKTAYIVPDLADASAVVSTVTVTNTGSVSGTYRIAVQKFGETLDSKHIIAFDQPLAANQMETLTLGITLARQDKIIVQSDTERLSFSVFGSENTL